MSTSDMENTSLTERHFFGAAAAAAIGVIAAAATDTPTRALPCKKFRRDKVLISSSALKNNKVAQTATLLCDYKMNIRSQIREFPMTFFSAIVNVPL